MTHNHFTDAVGIVTALTIGKVTTLIAQTNAAPDWISQISGPFGAIVTMVIVIWWLSKQNKDQSEKLEARQKVMDDREDMVTAARLESIKQMTEALTKTNAVIEQNNQIIARNSKSLDNHPCAKP